MLRLLWITAIACAWLVPGCSNLDTRAFMSAREQDSIYAYKQFLDTYPDADPGFRARAENRKAQLEQIQKAQNEQAIQKAQGEQRDMNALKAQYPGLTIATGTFTADVSRGAGGEVVIKNPGAFTGSVIAYDPQSGGQVTLESGMTKEAVEKAARDAKVAVKKEADQWDVGNQTIVFKDGKFWGLTGTIGD